MLNNFKNLLRQFIIKQNTAAIKNHIAASLNYTLSLIKTHKTKIKKITVFSSIAAASLFFISALGVYLKFLNDKDEIDASLTDHMQWMQGSINISKKPPVLIYASDGSIIGEYSAEHSSHITSRRCRNLTWLNRAAVSAEDRDFYTHRGISMKGILRAILQNALSFELQQGAGTITQQLARNLFTSRSWPLFFRKFYEIYAAFEIEQNYSKEEILCLYLNKIYMGEGMYGAEEAAEFYFRKKPENLSAAEAAMIAGLFPSPVRYSPLNNILRSLKKQNDVMNFLVEDGHLTEKEKKESLQAFIAEYGIKSNPTDSDPGTVGLFGINRYFRINHAPDVNEYVRRYLLANYPDLEFLNGLRVYTTVDRKKQTASMQAVRNKIKEVRDERAKTSPFPPQDTQKILNGFNGVFISLEPVSGEIRSFVGGFKTREDQYMDRAWNMMRQPGSSLKGFLYALALDEGIYGMDSSVNDEPVNFSGYKPNNWYAGYKGEMSLQKAVALSVNTVAVKILSKLGPSNYKNILMETADIPSDRFDANLSLALGTGEISPVELASIYGVLLNSGYRTEPHLIKQIITREGEVLFKYNSVYRSKKIMEASSALNAVSLMQNVVEDNEGTAHWLSEAMKKKNLIFPVAAKTGTVQTEKSIQQKYRNMSGVHDVWFVALVPGEVDVVWVGHDDGVPFEGSGSSTAAGLWFSYAVGALRDLKNQSFESHEKINPAEEDGGDGFTQTNTDETKTDTEPDLRDYEQQFDLKSQDKSNENNEDKTNHSEEIPVG